MIRREPPIAKKQQDHQRGQCRRHQAAHDDAVQGGFHEDRLIKKRREGHAGRQQVAQLWQNAVGAVDHRQRRTAAALADNNQHAGRAVSSNRVGLHLVTVVHVRHVADEHGPAIDLLDGKRIDLVDSRWAVVQRDVVVLAADLHVTRRHDDILSRERLSDVARCQPARLKGVLVEIGHDDPRLTPIGRSDRRATHHSETGPDDISGQIIQRRVGERIAGEA